MRRLFAITMISVIAACGPTPSPSPAAPSPTVSRNLSSVAPTVPSAPIPTEAVPSPSALVDFTAQSMLTAGDWRPGEAFLLSGFRADMETCEPRRHDLPDRATDGVECSMSAGAGERVGAYLFPNDGAARAAYEARLKENGLGWDDDGGCSFGTITPPVSAAYQPRAACFVNDAGVANLRIYWPGPSVMVGVLGRSGSIRDLATWASMLPPGQESSDVSDPWIGGIGEPIPFQPCVDIPAVDRSTGPTTLTYEGPADDHWGIWMAGPAGDDPRRLPTHRSRGVRLLSSWSPDGRHLAYAVNTGGVGEIWSLDPDDGRERRLARTQEFSIDSGSANAQEMSWSPDGRYIAYTAWRVIGAGYDPRFLSSVWVIDVAQGTKSRVSGGVLLDWSPDSTRLLLRVSDGPPLVGIAETTDPIVIHELERGTQTMIGRGAAAAWSSDCRHVLIKGGRMAPGLVVVAGVAMRPRLVLDGLEGNWSPVTDDLAVATGDGHVWTMSLGSGDAHDLGQGLEPAWSVDGSHVAYASTAQGEGLVIVRPDASDRRVVADDRYPLGGLSWSPDGEYIASSHEVTFDTCSGPTWGFVIATDGSGAWMLPSPYHVTWRPVVPSPVDASPPDAPPDRQEGCGG